jgi:DNA-binding winged helix-turn-helix (wHTH) protein/tetratricopeptide (TPR) repeat protein/TolB-like protein
VQETRYRLGEYEISSAERVLRRDGVLVALPPKAVSALLVLVSARGRVISKAELLEQVWPDSYVEEGNLPQTISIIRKQLAGDFPEGSPIETIARVGYVFRAEIVAVPAAPGEDPLLHRAPPSRADNMAAPPAPPQQPAALAELPPAHERLEPPEPLPAQITEPLPPSSPAKPISPAEQTTLWHRFEPYLSARGLALVLVLVVSTLALGFARHSYRLRAQSRKTHPRIAVLAFENLSGAPDQAWLSAAFRELLSADLGNNAQLEVIPPETVERSERELGLNRTDGLSDGTLRRICNDLDCDQIVTGSYLVNGGQVRLNAHLFGVGEKTSQLGDFISTAPINQMLPLVASADRKMLLSDGLHPEDGANVLAASSSTNSEAYRLYIEGVNKAREYDGPGASDLLQQSIALDPNFPLSHLELSGALTVLGEDERAIAEAHQAQALAGALPREQQLQIEARVMATEHKFDKAAQIYQTLLTFYPNKLNYARQEASMLDYDGHTDQAIVQLKQILNGSSPEAHDPRFMSTLADCYSSISDWPDSLLWSQKAEEESRRRGALILYERVLTTDTQALYHMAQLPLALSRTEEALALARRFGDYSGELRALNRIGQIETAMGQLAEAKAALQQALAREDQLGEKERQIHTFAALGQNLAQSGQPKQALDAFQQGLQLARWYREPSFIVIAELNVATAEAQLGELNQARSGLRQVVAEATAIGDHATAASASKTLATIAGH